MIMTLIGLVISFFIVIDFLNGMGINDEPVKKEPIVGPAFEEFDPRTQVALRKQRDENILRFNKMMKKE